MSQDILYRPLPCYAGLGHLRIRQAIYGCQKFLAPFFQALDQILLVHRALSKEKTALIIHQIGQTSPLMALVNTSPSLGKERFAILTLTPCSLLRSQPRARVYLLCAGCCCYD